MGKNKIELSVPGISFSRKRGEIFIYHSTIQALGDPFFIWLLWNSDKGSLAVQSLDRKERDSFVVPEYKEGDWNFRVYSEPLLRILRSHFKWDRNKTYRCYGVLHSESKLIEFDLNKAEAILYIDQ